MTAPVAYAPPLKAAELAAAVALVQTASHLTAHRAADTRGAVSLIARTGFAGASADAGLALLERFSDQFLAAESLARQAEVILATAHRTQRWLDSMARDVIRNDHIELIQWLNMMAWLLDNAAAQALLALLRGDEDDDFDPLVNHPLESLERIHERNLTTVPASTALAVGDAGGLILEAGGGRTSVLVGDTVAPSQVITMVAGVSTGHPDQLAGELEKAQRIARATGGAVVVWQGYVPPRDVGDGIDPGAARRGGDCLAAFQVAVDERFPHARRSVVAHSYGTVVAARAAAGPGLIADDVWLLGSPGVPVPSVEDMRLIGRSPRVFVADADADPIMYLRRDRFGVHGFSPSAEAFGATVVTGIEGGHSSYFTDPDFLSALAHPPE
ncbi:hypothetical protein CAPI_08535 [Corynebacterium capitovis DSM 44611]|uniref:alpha/beta hydrolase n=1 Tax=Corynebacterium capitovis TaxID=131081 RepID=UPI00037BBB44|nr:alpha/beta hydrolase [Corynebacterium capitovis]WKD58234.1 hypothetical protein CAPI_08535 [Corynebacterium capitovis DSM 44611]